MSNTLLSSGGCLCGKVRYELKGNSLWKSVCYCRSCCLSSGSPLIAWACFNKSNMTIISGAIAQYESSRGVFRGFCSHCGTTLTYNRESQDFDNTELNARDDEIFISISTIDAPEVFPPEEHIRCIEKVNWLQTTDNLPHYENFSMRFKKHQHQQSSVK